MHIDDAIYVGRPDQFDLQAEKVAFFELNKALEQNASGATRITVLGGYYNADALVALCSNVPKKERANCKVRIAVGLEATSLFVRLRDELTSVESRLRGCGFREVTVAIASLPSVHFHTKLFYFLHGTYPVWFIGSANPGSARHELMVRLTGRHDALSAYVDAVFDEAFDLTKNERPKVEIGTLRDFFLTGYLCHKPPVQRLFTFDAYRFTPEQRSELNRALGSGTKVEHASPVTQGFGFNLRSALGINGPISADDEEASQRVHYRPSSIETVYGFWMPPAYADEIKRNISDEQELRERRLEVFAEKLCSEKGRQQARVAFERHIQTMKAFLAESKIDAQPISNLDHLFDKFILSRSSLLDDPKARQRQAQVMVTAPMPDIWEDKRAAEEFEDSFFEDLAYRSGAHVGNRGRVVRSIMEALPGEPVKPKTIRSALASRLRAGSGNLDRTISGFSA
jgi:hypothetical protein